MKTFVLFQGGSGSVTAKAFSHLAAIGMINSKDSVHLQLCDKDADNKDTELAREVIGCVSTLTSTEYLKPAKGNGICDEKRCFTTNIIQESFNFTDSLKTTLQNNGSGDGADNAMSRWVIDKQKGRVTDRYLLDAFFSKEQQEQPIDVGFKGSASRGALIYSYLLEKDKSIVAAIQNHLATTNDHCKVFIVGSIFGGTGASMFLKTAEVIKELDRNRVHVAGALILPCFSFVKPGDSETKKWSIDSKKFWAKTMTSLEGYSTYPNLVKTSFDDDKGLLDRLYLAAQPNNELHYCTKKASEGGNDQERKSDFIDVITANYIVDFINAAPIEQNQCLAWGNSSKKYSNIFTFKYPDIGTNSPLTLACVPGLQKNIEKMLKFASVIFFMKWTLLNNQNDPFKIDWVRTLFKARRFGQNEYQKNRQAVNDALNEAIDTVFKYCEEFVNFVKDLSENGKPTSENSADFSENYKFFNEVSFDKLCAVKDSFDVNNKKTCSLESINAVLNLKDYCNMPSGECAMDILTNDSVRDKLVDGSKPEDAISAYINLLYSSIK